MRSDFEVRWRGVPADALTWRDWGADVLVFNQETGSTHLLGEFAAEVLRQLATARDSVTVGTLATRLADDPDVAPTEEQTGTITEALSDFARLGLARRELS